MTKVKLDAYVAELIAATQQSPTPKQWRRLRRLWLIADNARELESDLGAEDALDRVDQLPPRVFEMHEAVTDWVTANDPPPAILREFHAKMCG